MPLSLNSSSNLAGIHSGLVKVNRDLTQNLSRLSSGSRINRAADDAAGLAVAEKLSAQIESIGQSISNVSSGSSLLRTADGALSGISDLLSRGRELAVQAGNGALSSSQRNAINAEFQQIVQEIDRTAGTTEFNGQQLLTGELGPNSQSPVSIQVGPNSTPDNRIDINSIRSVDSASLGISGINLDSASSAASAVGRIDGAMSQITNIRAGVGSLENRFQGAAQQLQVSRENLISAETQIRGLDYASEISSFSQNQTALQAGLSSLQSAMKSQESLLGGLINTVG